LSLDSIQLSNKSNTISLVSYKLLSVLETLSMTADCFLYKTKYYNFVLFRAPDGLIVVTWFNHEKLTDSLFTKIELYKSHHTKNRQLTDLGACSRCANYDVTMYCDAKHDVTMRCLHQLIACISRSHWQIKEMTNSLLNIAISHINILPSVFIRICKIIFIPMFFFSTVLYIKFCAKICNYDKIS
jgi:hypothetical protein